MTKTDKLTLEAIDAAVRDLKQKYDYADIPTEMRIAYRNMEPLENLLQIHQNTQRGVIYGIPVYTDEDVPDDEVHVKYGHTIIKKFKIK